MPLLNSALSDIFRAWEQRAVWIELAAEDIADQHRSTKLGPLWQLVNYLAFAGVFMIIFGGIGSIDHFGSYVATGLLVWLFISELLSNSVQLFLREQGYIKGTNLPISLYIMRLSMQFYIRLGYAVCGCIFLVLLDGIVPTFFWIVAAMGLALVMVTAPAAITIFAFAGAYFPDLSFIIGNLVRIGMFLTPIFWVPGNGGLRDTIFNDFNPFTSYLQIVRHPILENSFPTTEFFQAAVVTGVLWIIAFVMLGGLRRRVVFLLQ